MDDTAALATARRFDRQLRSQVADRVDALPFGALVLTPSLANVHDLNHVLVDASSQAPPPEVLQVAEARLADHGVRHTQVVFEDGRRVASATTVFSGPGWERDDLVFMRLRDTARPAWPDRAVLLDEQQIDEFRRTLTLARDVGDPAALATSLVEFGRRVRAAADAQVVGVLDDDGLPLGWAWIYRDPSDPQDDVRQIEEVEVLEVHHAKGLGAVLMQAALHIALSDDPTVVFLVAEADDWPKG